MNALARVSQVGAFGQLDPPYEFIVLRTDIFREVAVALSRLEDLTFADAITAWNATGTDVQ